MLAKSNKGVGKTHGLKLCSRTPAVAPPGNLEKEYPGPELNARFEVRRDAISVVVGPEFCFRILCLNDSKLIT